MKLGAGQEFHRARYHRALRDAASYAQDARKALRAGNCRTALHALQNAEFGLGRFAAYFDSLDSPRKTIRRDQVVRQAVSKIGDAIRDRCFVRR